VESGLGIVCAWRRVDAESDQQVLASAEFMIQLVVDSFSVIEGLIG
jgi:hypothetical protein